MNRPLPETDFSPCNLCGSQTAEYQYPKFGIIKCAQCGLIRTARMPDNEKIRRLYSESYFRSSDSGTVGYDNYIKDHIKITRTFEKRMREIERWTGHTGRLLDVGCATGFSLDAAQKLGWKASGIEISEFACDYGRKTLGLDLSCGSLADVNFPPETFDAVTMWDYLEHSPDPGGEIEIAHGLLKKGGLLVLTTPDISSLPARIYGSRWMGIKEEEHLYYFSRDTIRGLLRKAHFETVRLEHAGKYIDLDFFIKRTGLYSTALEQMLERLSRRLGIGERVIYVNPFDIMLVYGEKIDKS